MAGHSKWKNIQHRKGAQDKKRGKIFTKIATELTVAAKLGGADPESNPRLRLALAKGKAANMPKDNIERAIKKGVGGGDTSDYTEKTYEGYGPGGVAFVVECLTDNINRTVGNVRHAFTKYGGNLGTDGSVSWMFHKKGLVLVERSKVEDYDQMFEAVLDQGTEDVKEEGDYYEITSAPEDFQQLKEAVDQLGLATEVAEITRIPENYKEVEGQQSESVGKMVDILEDDDDVQNVYHNASFPDD